MLVRKRCDLECFTAGVKGSPDVLAAKAARDHLDYRVEIVDLDAATSVRIAREFRASHPPFSPATMHALVPLGAVRERTSGRVLLTGFGTRSLDARFASALRIWKAQSPLSEIFPGHTPGRTILRAAAVSLGLPVEWARITHRSPAEGAGIERFLQTIASNRYKCGPRMEWRAMVDDHIKRKILLLGDGAVGKTSLIRRFVVDKFSDDYITTIGTKVTKKDLRIEAPGKATDLTFMIWDVLGQKGYKGIQESSFQGAKGALLVYDVTRPETSVSLQEYWIPHLLPITNAIPIVLVGNKVDLATSRREAQEDLDELKEELHVPGFLSSAKMGQNVETGFLALAKAIISQSDAKLSKREAVEETTHELIAVTDQIIMDFCELISSLRGPGSTSGHRQGKGCASRSTILPKRNPRFGTRRTSRGASRGGSVGSKKSHDSSERTMYGRRSPYPSVR